MVEAFCPRGHNDELSVGSRNEGDSFTLKACKNITSQSLQPLKLRSPRSRATASNASAESRSVSLTASVSPLSASSRTEMLVDSGCSQHIHGGPSFDALMLDLDGFVDQLIPVPLDPPTIAHGDELHQLQATEQGNSRADLEIFGCALVQVLDGRLVSASWALLTRS